MKQLLTLSCLALTFAIALPQLAQGQEEAAHEAALTQIKETLAAIRSAPDQDARQQKIDEIFEQCGAYLDEHAAASSAEGLEMAAGIWFEVAGMKEVSEEALTARIESLRQLKELPPKVEQAIAMAEAKLVIQVGKKAPNWTAIELHEGSEVTLESYEGKLVLMDFWATWCPPCKTLMEQKLAPLYAEYGEHDGFELVGIGVPWRGDTVEKQITFAEEKGYGWTKVFDEGADDAATYGVRGIPFLCLVDTDGTILAVGSGWQVIEEVEGILAERLSANQ